MAKLKQKRWYDYLWIATIIYFTLGLFNIVFAWLGLIEFLVPLGFAVFGGNKNFCNKYCGRSQLFGILGYELKISRNAKTPTILKTKLFRYGFLTFFMTMFINMLYTTYLVFGEAKSLNQVLKLIWTIRVPWDFAYTVQVQPWIAQFSFGFYSMMLTSTIIGLVLMFVFKPRTWCVICPMGSMTQGICKLKNS